MRKITESFRRDYEAEEYDVIVAGGGVAGIAAALAAARNHAGRVLLIERQYAVGGLATLGLVTIYLPLCDGMGHQVSFGIAEELLRLSIRYGTEARYPDAWLEPGNEEKRARQRFEVQFPANTFALLAEELLRQAGVEILYGTAVCQTQVEDGCITALFVENKSGRSALCARSFIDATGDADLCHLSGEQTAVFGQGNVLASWYYYLKENENCLKMLGFADIPDVMKTAEEKEKSQGGTRYTGLDGWELSRMTLASHRNLLADFLKVSGGDGRALTAMASIPQIRMTRRLMGRITLEDRPGARYEDNVGRIGDWRRRGPVYEIPFRCLSGSRIRNLLAVGRCISVTDDMWDITRVIPVCAVTGEAAGTAAALTCDFHAIDVLKLQERLRENGAL